MVGKIQLIESESTENQRKSVYLLGGITALIVVAASLMDIGISMALGGDVSTIPQTAVGRFAQFQGNAWLGLYYLDLLNMSTAIIMIPAFYALFTAHRRVNKVYSSLAMNVFSIGTAVFITNNTALPMLSLSGKYAIATSDAQKNLLAAAGEAMIARGAHGSPGVFLGFLMPIIASLIMSMIMLKGGIFSKINSYLGIAGSVLFICYFVLATFVPSMGGAAMILAMLGGLMTIAWMILFAIRLLKLRKVDEDLVTAEK